MREERIGPTANPVRKVDIYFDYYGEFKGFCFYDSESRCLLKSGNLNFNKFRFTLDEGERILGIKSRVSDCDSAFHSDL